MKPCTFLASASMTACWCSSLLPVWLPQEWQLHASEQNSCFWKHSQYSFRHRDRLQLHPDFLSATTISSASSLYTNGIIILCELLLSLLSEKEEDESLTVWETEKLSSNFLMNDFRKDSEPTEFYVSRWLRSLSEFYRELSFLMEEGKRRSLELDELRILRKSDRRLRRFLVERQWIGFYIFSMSMKWLLLPSPRNCQKMSCLSSLSSYSINSGFFYYKESYSSISIIYNHQTSRSLLLVLAHRVHLEAQVAALALRRTHQRLRDREHGADRVHGGDGVYEVEGVADEAELAEVEARGVAVAHLVAAVVAGHFVHLADVFGLAFVHIGEVNEDAALGHFLVEDGEHLERGLAVEGVAVLGLDHLVALDVVQSGEVFIIDVLDIDPLDLEVALELERVVLPPEGEGLLVVGGFEPGDALEHAALDCAEEEVGIGVVIDFSLPQLFDFAFIFGGGGPYSVLDGLGRQGGTLWTLSSLALRMTMPLTLGSRSASGWEFICLRWGKDWKMDSQSEQFFASMQGHCVFSSWEVYC